MKIKRFLLCTLLFLSFTCNVRAGTLTKKGGINTFNGHQETWYNLDMTNVVKRTDQAFGMTNLYWVRDDGCKMYGPWIICAADWNIYTHYSLVETSRGIGIVLDTGEFIKKDPTMIDLAVAW